MRIVPNLKEVYECPNCGKKDYFLHNRTNDMGREYLFCACCHEEIYENETTCSEEKTMTDNFDYIHYCPKCMSNKLTTVYRPPFVISLQTDLTVRL